MDLAACRRRHCVAFCIAAKVAVAYSYALGHQLVGDVFLADQSVENGAREPVPKCGEKLARANLPLFGLRRPA